MRKILLLTLSIFTILTLAGCGKKEVKNEEQKQEEVTEKENKPNNEEKESNNQVTENEELIIKNPGSIIGTRTYDVKLNNKDIKLKIEYINYPNEKLIEEDSTYYITYKVYLDNKLINDLTDKILYDEEEMKELISKNYNSYDFFGDSLNPTILKGKDKEYILLHAQGGGFLNSENLYIINESGKLLGGLYIDKNMGVQLTGKDADKYKTENSYSVINYYYVNSEKITYLTPTEEMYITDEEGKHVDYEKLTFEFDEYTITIDNDKLINTKTGNLYKGNEAEGGSSDFTRFYTK